jgi:hypothetical protein
VFGDAPFLQVPFTTDTRVVEKLLDETDVGMAGPQTSLGDAVGLALRVLEKSRARSRVVIVLTDGNDTGHRSRRCAPRASPRSAAVKLYLTPPPPRSAGECPSWAGEESSERRRCWPGNGQSLTRRAAICTLKIKAELRGRLRATGSARAGHSHHGQLSCRGARVAFTAASIAQSWC